jgi:hypothetical protein
VDRTRVNVFERWAGPADLDAFRASGAPDDETHDFSRIRRFEIEHYSGERRSKHRLIAGRAERPGNESTRHDRFHPHAARAAGEHFGNIAMARSR